MKKVFLIVAVLAVVLVGAYLLLQKNDGSSVKGGDEQNQQQTNNSYQDNSNSKTYEVKYTASGYSPSQLTIKVGDTVVFKNESPSSMWVASAMHPSHTVYSGTSLQEHCPDPSGTAFDQCTSAQPGQSWSFTFTKTGEWAYHNHVAGPHFGKIIVE